MNNKIIIGVDLGGTKIMTGAITREGNVLGEPIKVPTGANDPAEMIVKRITDSIEKTLRDLRLTVNDLIGIGIGSTGPVDSERGEILECPQLPNMHFFNLLESIKRHFGITVRLNNDANCLILGECVFGAAADKKNVVGFTLGTGIGCAIVLDKKILNGSTGTAAEIWPSPYKSGMIEDVPIAWSINLIDPQVVIIGGSIASAYPFFKTSMEDNLRKWVCPVPAIKTKVVLAKLGDYAGFIGAACLMIDDD
jgi:glucokinase